MILPDLQFPPYIYRPQRFMRETSVWFNVHHPNITPLLGISTDFDQPNKPCLVLPYYQHGNIVNYIRKHPYANKPALVSCIVAASHLPISVPPQLAEVASAVSYLHDLSILHGDLRGVSISAEALTFIAHRV